MSKKIKKAIISLSDKSEIKLILNILKKYRVNVISSGGTSKGIKKLGYKCTEVSEYTNTDEILEGRVKTLHPKIYAGILSKRENKNHIKFTNIVTHFPSNIYGHAFYFDYTLNKNENGKWEIVELIEPDHTPF